MKRAALLFWAVVGLVATSCPIEALSVGQQQVALLASYPRSGNHWTRCRIESATGILTGCAWQSNFPLEPLNVPHTIRLSWGWVPPGGLTGECQPPRGNETATLFTHCPLSGINYFDRQPRFVAVVLVRDPRASIRSQFITNKINTPSDQEVRQRIELWKKFINYWIDQEDVTFYRYEDLRRQEREGLVDLLQTLRYRVTDEDIDRALKAYPARASRTSGDVFYTESQHLLFEEVRGLMEAFGYSLESKEWLK